MIGWEILAYSLERNMLTPMSDTGREKATLLGYQQPTRCTSWAAAAVGEANSDRLD